MKHAGTKDRVEDTLPLRMMRSEIPERELIARIEAEVTDLANTAQRRKDIAHQRRFLWPIWSIARWLLAEWR